MSELQSAAEQYLHGDVDGVVRDIIEVFEKSREEDITPAEAVFLFDVFKAWAKYSCTKNREPG